MSRLIELSQINLTSYSPTVLLGAKTNTRLFCHYEVATLPYFSSMEGASSALSGFCQLVGLPIGELVVIVPSVLESLCHLSAF